MNTFNPAVMSNDLGIVLPQSRVRDISPLLRWRAASLRAGRAAKTVYVSPRVSRPVRVYDGGARPLVGLDVFGNAPHRRMPMPLKGVGSESKAALTTAQTRVSTLTDGVGNSLSRKSKVIDVLLVLAWGGIVPALMWLGAASGF